MPKAKVQLVRKRSQSSVKVIAIEQQPADYFVIVLPTGRFYCLNPMIARQGGATKIYQALCFPTVESVNRFFKQRLDLDFPAGGQIRRIVSRLTSYERVS